MTNTAEIINFQRPVVKANIETGYDRLAHDITNTLITNPAKLTGVEIQVLFAIVAKTYRFQKKEDWVANSQICDMTKLSKGHVSNTIKSLINKKVIIKNGKKIGINSVVSEWKVHKSVNDKSSQSNERQFTNSCTEVHKSVNESTQICETHKKETITKETNTKERVSQAEKVKDLYNSILANSENRYSLPKVKVLTEKRKKVISKLLGLVGKDLTKVEAYFNWLLNNADNHKWIFGDNQRGWTADIEYVCRDETFAKATENRLVDWGAKNDK